MLRFILSAVIFALLNVTAHTAAHAENNMPTMTLTGTGEISATPDMALVTSGVITQGKTAREALDANNQAMAELMNTLEQMGVEAIDVQTSNFSVQPDFSYPNSNDTRARQIDGYTVSNNVTVRVRNLADLGRLLDGFVSVGANQIHNVSFSVQETADLYVQARRAAVADALEKASLYADAAGITLGNIISISESGGANPYPQEMAMMRMASDASVPVAAGELSFSSSVNIQWNIGQ